MNIHAAGQLSRPKIKDIRQKLKRHIHKTPILTSRFFNEHISGEVYFKCENFQKTGSFKIRGAINAALKIIGHDKETTVITHSSGNHGQALAYAAKVLNINAVIVMPNNAPRVKVDAVKSYGARVVMCKPTQQDREKTCGELKHSLNAYFIPPFDHIDIIQGQSTCAAEFLEEHPDLDYLLTPVGGGGLLSGSVLATKALELQTRVIGCEPKNANDAFLSLKQGIKLPAVSTQTIADGLRTSLGEINFQILKDNKIEILTVSEEEILHAFQTVLERMKIIIEPSCAVPVAVYMKYKERFENKKTGIILSGGNVDLYPLFTDLKNQIKPHLIDNE